MICGIRKKLKMWITILILNHTLDTMNQVAQQQRHKSVTHYKGKNAKRISRPSAFPGYDSNTCYQNNKKYNNSYFVCNVNVTWFGKYAKLPGTFFNLMYYWIFLISYIRYGASPYIRYEFWILPMIKKLRMIKIFAYNEASSILITFLLDPFTIVQRDNRCTNKKFICLKVLCSMSQLNKFPSIILFTL